MNDQDAQEKAFSYVGDHYGSIPVGCRPGTREGHGWKVELVYRLRTGENKTIGVILLDSGGTVEKAPSLTEIRQAIDAQLASSAPHNEVEEIHLQAKELRFLAGQRLALDLTLDDLEEAQILLEPFRNLPEIATDLDEIERLQGALGYLRQEIINSAYSRDYQHQIAVLMQFSDLGCPNREYSDLPLYRRWCVRSLMEILEVVLDENPSIVADAWAVASAAASYLSRLGTSEALRDPTADQIVLSTAFNALKETADRCATTAAGPRLFWFDVFASYALFSEADADLERIKTLIKERTKSDLSPILSELRDVVSIAIAYRDKEKLRPIEDLRQERKIA